MYLFVCQFQAVGVSPNESVPYEARSVAVKMKHWLFVKT